jgi:iron complex outermembrane receptor protein
LVFTTQQSAGRLPLFAAASILVWTGSAAAQTQPAPNAGAAVQEIVVTAQRRAEAMQNVPISITSATGEKLERSGITRLEDLSQIATGVQISRTGVYTQPAIRGVTTAQAVSAENNVAIYIDGFYQPSARALNFELANLNNVQVLKGPQGTLFGRNATGGAILIQTLMPSLTERSGRISIGYGNYDDRRGQFYFSTPIVADKLAVNVSANYRKTGGYIEDVRGFSTAPLSTYTVDAKVKLQASDRLTIVGDFTTSKLSDGRPLAVTSEGFEIARLFVPNGYIEHRDNRTSLTHPVINTAIQTSGSVHATYDFDWATLNSYSYIQVERDQTYFETDATAAVVYDQIFQERYRTATQEINLASNKPGRLQYVVGVYLYDETQQSYGGLAGGLLVTGRQTPPYQVQRSNFTTTESYAGYADLTYEAIDHLFLTGGIRYSHEKKDATIWAPTNGALEGQREATWDATTPRAVIRWEFAQNTNVYASWSKGFKSGLFNPNPPFVAVAPEKIVAYEVGFKTLRGPYRLEAAAFHYDYDNLQVSSTAVIANVSATQIANAAKAKIYGGEISFGAHLFENLNISAGVAYTHARYDSFPNAPVSIPRPPTNINNAMCNQPAPLPAGTTVGQGGLCVQNWDGRRIARAPDWTANFNADYTIPLPVGKLLLSGNVAYTGFYIPTKSDIALDGSGGYRYGAPAYTLLNLQASWSSPKMW